jgi:hypothetical protein
MACIGGVSLNYSEDFYISIDTAGPRILSIYDKNEALEMV